MKKKLLRDMTEPELRRLCNEAAQAVEGVGHRLGVERPHFVLLLFNDPEIAQYVSNCSRENMVQALREAAGRLGQGGRGAMSDEPDPEWYDPDDYPDEYAGCEPIGSCEWCDQNIYHDDFDGLCEQCAWHAEQNGRDVGADPKTGE